MDKLNKLPTVAALLGLCALVFFLRLHTYDEPLERDMTTYAVIAHEMLDGKKLYSDLWDHKPPAIHVTYAIAESVAGYGRDSIFLMNVAATLATLLACYFAGSTAGAGRMGGLVAAALWTITSGDLAIQGNQPNTEVFLNAFLAAAFVVFVRREKGGLGLRGAVLAGVLLATASLYKQVVAVEAALLAFAYFVLSPATERKKALAEVALIAAIGAIAWLLVFGYFASQGRAQAFIEAVFTYNRWYSGNIWANLSHALSKPAMSMHALAPLLLMGILSAAGMISGLVFGPRRPWILLFAFAAATHIAVLMPGHFYAHYYQLWLPPLSIGAGWTVALLKRILPVRFSRLSYGVAAAACLILAAFELPYYRLSATSWSEQKYGNLFSETDRLAYGIDKLLPPAETFYEWGNESGFYFTSGRRPASGIVFVNPVLAGPIAAKLSQRLLCDLEQTKPDLVVINYQNLARPGHLVHNPVLNWFAQNYRPFSEANMFLLLVRKGGELDRRKPIRAN
jgi:4-amino-4-deoxy-L-arabinose transferase-like glycosyltransferase